MDFGIRGKRAIVCAASKGLGRGCAEALAGEGVDLVICARTKADIERTAGEIEQRHGVSVTPIACDIATDEGRAAVLEACANPDILVNNGGGPPPGLWSDWGRDEWLAAVEQNMLTPILMINAALPGMMARGWGRIVNITSASVKSPIPLLGLSNAARSGLTGFVAGTARQVAAKGVTINNLLPGAFDTDRIAALNKAQADREGRDASAVMADRAASIPVKRIGDPKEFGAACAFLCSDHAGYIVGQNWLLDGGAFNING